MDWSNKKVLIAEDEITNTMLLEEYLEPTGIQVFRASNGLELLEILKELTPDVILLDMKMPLMSGFEFIEKIRNDNLKIHVIAQTAYSMKGDREKIISAGCDDYISKPINEEILLSKLEMYFNKQ
jgi:CheY-like chemotaxis protein